MRDKNEDKEAVKMAALTNKILAVIEVETDYTYQDVIRVLDSINKEVRDKNEEEKENSLFGIVYPVNKSL